MGFGVQRASFIRGWPFQRLLLNEFRVLLAGMSIVLWLAGRCKKQEEYQDCRGTEDGHENDDPRSNVFGWGVGMTILLGICFLGEVVGGAFMR